MYWLDDKYLMDRVHWRMVPALLQAKVWRAYHFRAKDPQALMLAQQDAIDAVNEKLGVTA